MKVDRLLRILVAALIVTLLVVGLAAVLFLTESALVVWDQLQERPVWLRFLVGGVLAAMVLSAFWFLLRWLLPHGRKKSKKVVSNPLSADELSERLAEAAKEGIDTAPAVAELERSKSRERQLDIAVFGEISSGKSAIIKALLPRAEVTSSPLGGSTTELMRYHWRSDDGLDVNLIDMPGTGGVEDYDADVIDEARRAHVVLFVCDAEFTKPDFQALERLGNAGKPLVVALNKADQYTREEITQILTRMHERVLTRVVDVDTRLVPVSAGGNEAVVVRDADGQERHEEREREPVIVQLVLTLNTLLRERAPELMQRREQALFALATDKLNLAQDQWREDQATQVVRSYTKKAVVGALAAVSPGTDIVIQAYLATGMVKALSQLYDGPVRDVEVEEFLNLSQSRVGKTLPLSLAVAGNGLKAFPGIGTVTGGLVHAVAYGLIFDAMGRSLANSLSERRSFEPAASAADFGAELNRGFESRVADIVRLALTDGSGTKRD
ncbi:MAG: GTPase [Pseudomonadota bacterium]